MRLLEQKIHCYSGQAVPVLTLTKQFLENKVLNAQEAVLVLLGLDIGQLITPNRNDECTCWLVKNVFERPTSPSR